MSRQSRLASRQDLRRESRKSRSSFGKDVEYQLLVQEEIEYSSVWSRDRFFQYIDSISANPVWNSLICIIVLAAIFWQVMGLDKDTRVAALDVLYNVVYTLHILGTAYNTFVSMEYEDTGVFTMLRFGADALSYIHYVLKIKGYNDLIKLLCYYLRLHRPFHYLWELNGYNLNGSIIGTALKYMYIFAVVRIVWADNWARVDSSIHYYGNPRDFADWVLVKTNAQRQSEMLGSLFFVAKMFVPIGPSFPPARDFERIAYLIIAITGCLVVTGAAVASLSLVIGLYMRPEEAFRARYRLIMKEMDQTNVPTSLRDKVQSFYKMYWHKQRAVSETELLKIFPPTLATLVFMDIYFEATQRSRILCDLTFEFLSEVVKKMTTIHYIPGDAIIKRNTTKSSLIFITYGDIEMLTAEDDSTAILRMTRGTVLSPCAGGVPAGCCKSHVTIRAATFCTAHVLDAGELWRVARKYGKANDQSELLLECFYEHFDKVKKYQVVKYPEYANYKSSILNFKNDLRTVTEAKDAEGKLILSHPEIFLEIAGSYIMRNRDETSSDETDAICLKSSFPCILQPDSSLQVVWQIVVSLFALIAAVVYPYYLVFVVQRPPEFSFFDNVANVINIIDVIVHLSTGAHVEEGVPINFSQTSSQQLRSIWFVLDVAAIMPLLAFVGEGHFDGIQKLFKLPKVFRNLKALEELWVYNSNCIRFTSFTLLTLILCYLIATLQQGFMCFRFGHCVVKNYTEAPHWHKIPLNDDTDDGRVLWALYWAISVMTWTSHKPVFGIDVWDNVVYTLLLLEICIVIHVFIESFYSATIMVTTFLRDDYDTTITNVKNFMIRNDVDPQMRSRFITYLELCWYTDKAYSMTNRKKSIFYDLPPHVYQEIVSRNRSKYLLTIPIMKMVSRADLKTISSAARLFYTSPNEILMNTGDITNEIFVIKQGICEVINPDTKEVVTLLTSKGHFGVLECLLRLPAFYTVRAVTHVHIFSISKNKLPRVIESPAIKSALKHARSLPEYQNLMSRREAFLYFEPLSPPPNRERFRLPKKYEMDSEFLQPFNKLGFLSVLRYVFPRFTIRPDGKYLQRYEWFRGLCALMGAMIFPCYGHLVLQWPRLNWAKMFLDGCAYFDMIQRLLVGYYNELGILVYHPAATAAYYIRSAFIVDFLACAPLEFLESEKRDMDLIGGQYMFRRSTTRQLLRMNRLIQMYRLPSAINSLTGIIERRDIHVVIQAIPFFMTLLNVLTFCVITYSVDLYGYEGWGWYIKPLPDQGGSWLTLFADVYRFNMTETPWNLHLAAYSWVVYETCTTGFNSFNPTNQSLMTVLFLGMFVGTMMITYYSVCIISIRANVNKELAGFQDDLRDIIAFMRKEQLEKDLKNEVLKYYEYNWERMRGVDYNRILKLCDQNTLRTDAILQIYGPTFAKCPFLKSCDKSLLRIMGREVRSMYLLRGMHIIEVDDVISNMYFLVFGQAQVRVFHKDRSQIFQLRRGSVFGNLDPIETVRSNSTIVALSRIHILQINAFNFHQILEEFPKVQKLFNRHRGENENFIPGVVIDPRISRDSLSTSMIFRGRSSRRGFTYRKNVVKYLYLKDKYLLIYLILVSLSCIYADVYNAGFQNNTKNLIIILYCLDFGFCLKILLQLIMPFIIATDQQRRVLLPMRRSYFKFDFKFDVLSLVPIELFCFVSHEHQWMIFSWLRLNRLLRLITVNKCLQRHHERLNINLTIATVCTVLIWFSLFIHTTACVWYFIGTMEDKNRPGISWLNNGQSNTVAGKPGLPGRYNGTWCHDYYLCSVYFILTTFTQNGVGDIMPKVQSEVIFVCMLQIVSTMVYMVYVGEFSNIIQYQSFRSFGYYCKCLELQHFLHNNRVSQNLANIVNEYALHLWRQARGYQVPHFLESAPDAIKLKVMSAAYMVHIKDHIVFNKCEPAFLRQLVGKFKMYYYTRDMLIVKEGEITDSMYFVHSGQVVETSLKTTVKKTIIVGRSFGLIQGLIPDTPFKNSYQTVMKSQILFLSYADWSYLLRHFPDSAAAIYSHFGDEDDSSPYIPPSAGYGQKPNTPFRASDQKPSTSGRRRPSGPPRQSRNGSEPTIRPADIKQGPTLNVVDTASQSILRHTGETPSELELTKVKLDKMPTVSLKESTSEPHLTEPDEGEEDEGYKYKRSSKIIEPESIKHLHVSQEDAVSSSTSAERELTEIKPDKTPTVLPKDSTSEPSIPKPEEAEKDEGRTSEDIDPTITNRLHFRHRNAILSTPSAETLSIKIEGKRPDSTRTPTTSSAPSSESPTMNEDLITKANDKGFSIASLLGLTWSENVEKQKLLEREKDESITKSEPLSRLTLPSSPSTSKAALPSEQPPKPTQTSKQSMLQYRRPTPPKHSLPTPKSATPTLLPSPESSTLTTKSPTSLPSAPQFNILEPMPSNDTVTTIHKDSITSIESLKPAPVTTTMQKEESYPSHLYPVPHGRHDSSTMIISSKESLLKARTVKEESASGAFTDTVASTSLKDSSKTSQNLSPKREIKNIELKAEDKGPEERLTNFKPQSIVKNKDTKDKILKSNLKSGAAVDFDLYDNNDANRGLDKSSQSQSSGVSRRLVRVRYEDDVKSKSDESVQHPRDVTKTDTDGDDASDTASVSSQMDKDGEKERKKKK